MLLDRPTPDLKVTPLDASIRRQTTIATPVQVSGFGFWSGRDITVEFRPAPENSGIVFVRSDLPNAPRIPGLLQNRVPGPRRTTLVYDGCSVEMVEHVLAALAGLQIDNCEIHVTAAEMPGMDGSSACFVEALLDAGRVSQDAWRPTLRVVAPLRIEEANAWIEAVPASTPGTHFSYQLDYPHAPAIGAQSYSARLVPEVFVTQVSSARTFVLKSEADQLREKGLGGRVSYQDILVFDQDGPLENDLRYANECARHKTLDMIGDFALLGKDLVGKIIASKSGHRLNSQMAFALLQQATATSPVRKSA